MEGVEVAGGDDTGGEGYEGYAEEGGEHGDTAAYGGDGVDIAIAHGGEGDGGPVEGIEECGESLGATELPSFKIPIKICSLPT